MVSSLTKRLLREWKSIVRSSHGKTALYHIKPQDSNLYIWHLVLNDPMTSMEIYMQLFIADDNEHSNRNSGNHIIVLRSLTPNCLLPINKNISLTHLSHILIDEDLNTFIMNIWHTFFGSTTYKDNRNNNSDIINSSTSRAWNRIMCKDFKYQFPELLGSLQPGDYQSIKTYSKWLNSTNIFNYNPSTSNYNTDTFYQIIFNHSLNNKKYCGSHEHSDSTCINSENAASLCNKIDQTNIYPFWSERKVDFTNLVNQKDKFSINENPCNPCNSIHTEDEQCRPKKKCKF